MADIQSAAQWIGRLLVEEARYLYKIEDKVKELMDELEWMQCFLRDVDASQHDNAMARRWVAQIREFAYEAEDIIENFLVRVVPHRRSRGDLLSLLRKYSRILWEVKALHKIGDDIESLKDKMSALTSRLHTYGIQLRVGESSSSWLSNLRDDTFYNISKQDNIIGRDDDIRELMEKVVMSNEIKVIAIYGVGGIGKTFLAKKIFHHAKIRSHFEAFAWAYVSQPCQISSVEQELLTSLTSKSREQIGEMTDAELKDELRKVLLRRTSLVVLDGVWGKEVWESLKEAFPITNRDFKSKLIITTRLEQVAKHVDKNAYVHKLEFLNNDQSKKLLQEKVKAAPTDHNPVHGGKDQTGCNANKLRDEMLGYCAGLPLAIVMLGGVLATKKTLKEWESVHKSIAYITEEDEHSPWRRILELSYYDLPYQLKPCFLYLGYFPTNLEIPTRKITRLWEAEGLVSSVEDEISDETLQDVAECCLGELLERSLVQVGSRGLSGQAKTCLLHDIMRELCVSKGSKANWLSIVQLGVETVTSSSSKPSNKPSKSSRSAKKRYRRLAIYCSDTLKKLPSDYRHAKYIRSLLFFNTLTSDDVLIPLHKSTLRKAFNDFKLLRVLDIEHIEVPSLPEEVGFLIHLRYLSLKGSLVSKLPSTIKYLRSLQTLDLRVLSFVHLRIPNVLWNMDRLVHLYLPPKSFILKSKVGKLRLSGLINLETLVNFSNKCMAEDVGKLNHLRKFSSCEFLTEEKILLSLASPSSTLIHIEDISIKLEGGILKDARTFAGCKNLLKLWLKGQITESVSSLELYSLVQLSLCGSGFQDDPMPVLEKLTNLKKLSLEEASYEGTTIRCSMKGFAELSFLTLKGLANLQECIVEKGAMPKLFRLEINRCRKLEMIPDGLRFLLHLQELAISYMPLSFYQTWIPVKSLKEWPDFPKVEHVPYIRNSHILDLN